MQGSSGFDTLCSKPSEHRPSLLLVSHHFFFPYVKLGCRWFSFSGYLSRCLRSPGGAAVRVDRQSDEEGETEESVCRTLRRVGTV